MYQVCFPPRVTYKYNKSGMLKMVQVFIGGGKGKEERHLVPLPWSRNQSSYCLRPRRTVMQKYL